jgi:hypothetical protein
MRYSLIVFLVLGASVAAAQRRGVILVNAQDEHTSCITVPAESAENTSCANQPNITLGRTVQLLVLNRRFLTNYSLEIGESATRTTSPRALGGAVVPIPFPREAVDRTPRTPAIERKGADELLGLLLDVTSSSDALAEIDRESEILDLELERIRVDYRAFRQTYAVVVGEDTENPTTDECNLSHERKGFWVMRCLQRKLQAVPPSSEAGFREFVVEVDTLFEGVSDFAGELAAAKIFSHRRDLESEIIAYRRDLQVFQSNLNAAQDAVWVVKQLIGAMPNSSLLSLQIRQQLRRRLGAANSIPGSSKPALDVEETNVQIDRYFALLSDRNSIPQFWTERLDERIRAFETIEVSPVDPETQCRMSDAPCRASHEIRDKTDAELRVLISQINTSQQRLAELVNERYRLSSVPVTQNDFGLDQVPANGVVSYRILRTTEFEPYFFSRTPRTAEPATYVDVADGAFAVDRRLDKKTVWQILKLAGKSLW